jgi:signal transduction histidine kinase
MKRIILIFALLFSVFSVAQESDISNKIDDLKAHIERSEKDEKLKLLDSLSKLVRYKPKFNYDAIVSKTIAYALLLDSLNMATHKTADLIYYNNSIVFKPQEGLVLFKQFIAENLRAQNNNSLARLYLNGADSYFFINNFEEALTNYEISKSYALKAKNDRLLGFVNLYMGQTNETKGGFVAASQNYKKAYSYFLKVKDTHNIVNTKQSHSILYSKNGFYKEAQKERDEYTILLKKTNNYVQLANTYFNSSIDFGRLGMLDKRIDNLLKAIETSKKSERAGINRSIFLNSLVVAYAKNNNIELAEKYLKDVESNPEQNTKGRNKAYYKKAKMHVAFTKGKYKRSLLIAKELLTNNLQKGEPKDIERTEKFISLIYEKLGDSKNSLIYLKKHLQIIDSIQSIQKMNALSYYQTIYETEKRDFKIKEQSENISLLNVQNKVKNQWFIFTSTGLLSLFVFMYLLRSRNIAFKRRKVQQQFSQDLIKVKENESTRLARELHDSVGQKMMLLSKKIKLSGNDDISQLADSTLQELRNISKNLYPSIIDQLGITSAIIALVNEVDAHTNLFFTNDIDNIDTILDKESNLHLYRVLQELLNNIVKHAAATNVFVTIQKNANSINMKVRDNGKGFDYFKAKRENKNLGMITILERSKIINSKLEIKTNIGAATTVKLIIPIK